MTSIIPSCRRYSPSQTPNKTTAQLSLLLPEHAKRRAIYRKEREKIYIYISRAQPKIDHEQKDSTSE